MALDRRTVLGGALLVATGGLAGAASMGVPALLRHRLPISGGYAPGSDHNLWAADGQQTVTWHVRTDRPLVALTFDDGPGPQYTPLVLDTLAAHNAPATFFLVGSRLERHHGLLAGKLDHHEVGNHTWDHADLAQLDYAAVTSQLARTHAAIQRHLGRTARLLRPPWGHLGGSTLLAANALGYDVVLWSHQMREKHYAHDPAGQVRDIVESVRPGAVILAHDLGDPLRLVALGHLGEIIEGIRARGLELVTVSELMAAAGPSPVLSPVPGPSRAPSPAPMPSPS